MLTTGCDKTTPACIMAAATVNIPAIVLSGGPMNNGWHHGERTGSGTIVWQARAELAEGKIDYEQFMEIVTSSAPSVGHCNTMGTASTMNALAEALGMSLPGCAAIPGAASRARPDRLRDRPAHRRDGVGGSEAVRHPHPRGVRERDRRQQRDRRLDQRADPHQRDRPPYRRRARHRGLGEGRPQVPLLVNMQPAGKYLGEEFHRAGGVPAVVNELMKSKLIHEGALTVNGKTIGENCKGTEGGRRRRHLPDRQAAEGGRRLHRAARQPVRQRDHEDERDRRGVPQALPLQRRATRTPSRAARSCSTGPRIITTASRTRSSKIDEHCMLFIRGTGPIGYPGGAEVVNMQPPAALIKKGVNALPCIGDGRQSGTSGSPSILNASPEAAAGGGLALLRTGDRVRIDLKKRTANILISDAELAERRAALAEARLRLSRRARRRGSRSSARWWPSSTRAWC